MSCHITSFLESEFRFTQVIRQCPRAVAPSAESKRWLKQIAGQMTIIPKPDVTIICPTIGYEQLIKIENGMWWKKMMVIF